MNRIALDLDVGEGVALALGLEVVTVDHGADAGRGVVHGGVFLRSHGRVGQSNSISSGGTLRSQ